MTPLFRPRRALRCARPPALVGVAAALVVGLSACGDDPFLIRWQLQADTVLLYSLARPELNLDAGFSFQPGILGPVRIEAPTATGLWDVAVDTRGGQIVLLPPGALGVESRAAVTEIPGMRRTDVVEAPADTAVYSVVNPVPVSLGNVYVVRTGRSLGAFGTRCVYYARLEPVVIDVAGGTLTFVYDASPVCNSRSLIPPD